MLQLKTAIHGGKSARLSLEAMEGAHDGLVI